MHSRPRAYAPLADLPQVQVFGQPELVRHLEDGGAHHTHLVSIANPGPLFVAGRQDRGLPPIFRREFDSILRLRFYDVDRKGHLPLRQFPRRIPKRADVRRAIRFYEQSYARASGYTIHCWQGVSRSTAFALGYLCMMTGSEERAIRILARIRPQAGPHLGIVRWFDEELGSSLTPLAERHRDERFERWKAELDLTEDSLLEELESVE